MDQIVLGGAFGTAPYGGNGGEAKGTQQCPPGTVVAGLYGKRSSSNVISIGLICRVPATGTCKLYRYLIEL